MFKWKRRQSGLPKAQTASQPSVAEKDRPVSYDLFDAQLQILGDGALMIVDAGANLDHTTEQYLKKFPRARVLAIESIGENVIRAKSRESAFGDRLELVRAILSDSTGVTEIRQAAAIAPETIDTVTVGGICAARGIESVDVLKVNAHGGELQALKGAETMLARGAIRLVVVRVTFVPLEDKLPTFWYITDHLRRHGYALQGIYEWHHQPRMPAILREAEVVFVAPQMQVLPEAPLSSPLLDKIFETAEGFRLPDRFFRNVRLHEGATVRAQVPVAGHTPALDQPVGTPLGLASITNVIIDTSAEPYRYSVVMDADGSATRHLQGSGFIVVEFFLKVIAGSVSIVWTDKNYQPLVATERYVSAAPGLQRVLTSIPSRQAHHLVLRNFTHDSKSATFKIAGVRAKLVGDSPRKGASDEPDAEALYLRAQTMARAGDLSRAARTFSDAAALVPGYAEALEGQGEMFDMMGRSDLATAKYDAVRALRAEGRPGMPDRTIALRRRGRSTAEIAGYTSMLHTAKHRALAYIARGNAFLAEGRADRALADYESALQLKPTAHEITALKGEALSMLGCYVEALEVFDLAIAARPQDAEALSGRAIVHLALDKLESADADWRRQLELLPPGRASARACVALRLTDYEIALPELERALEKDPSDPYWQLYRLTALRRLGRPATPVDPAVTTDVAAKGWPYQLLALHAGGLAGDQVLTQADNDGRRAEALFQLGVRTFPQDREEARRFWTDVLGQSRPDLIEHAAARHELARLGS